MDDWVNKFEETGELAQVIRREKRAGETGGIQGTIEGELYDVLNYVAALANVYDIDLEACFERKEEINRVKWSKLQDRQEVYGRYRKWKLHEVT